MFCKVRAHTTWHGEGTHFHGQYAEKDQSRHSSGEWLGFPTGECQCSWDLQQKRSATCIGWVGLQTPWPETSPAAVWVCGATLRSTCAGNLPPLGRKLLVNPGAHSAQCDCREPPSPCASPSPLPANILPVQGPS